MSYHFSVINIKIGILFKKQLHIPGNACVIPGPPIRFKHGGILVE